MYVCQLYWHKPDWFHLNLWFRNFIFLSWNHAWIFSRWKLSWSFWERTTLMEVCIYVQFYMYFFITSKNCTKLWDRDSSSLGKNYLPRIFFWWCCSNDRFWLPFQQRETANVADTMYIHFWCTKTHPTIIKSYIAKMVLGHHENHFGKDISKNSRGKGRPWVTSLWDRQVISKMHAS